MLQPLRDAGQVRGHRIHGDLHAGQFLRAGTTMLVTDFDGNPLQDLEGDAAAVAAARRGIDGAVDRARRRGRREATATRRVDDVDRFTRQRRQRALDAYVAATPSTRTCCGLPRRAGAARVRLLDPHLPHWRYVADSALPTLLGRR